MICRSIGRVTLDHKHRHAKHSSGNGQAGFWPGDSWSYVAEDHDSKRVHWRGCGRLAAHARRGIHRPARRQKVRLANAQSWIHKTHGQQDNFLGAMLLHLRRSLLGHEQHEDRLRHGRPTATAQRLGHALFRNLCSAFGDRVQSNAI